MGKKDKRTEKGQGSLQDQRKLLVTAVLRDDPEGIARGLHAVRQSAIRDQRDIYTGVISDARNLGANSEAYAMMCDLDLKISTFLDSLSEGGDDLSARQDLIDGICDSQNRLYEKMKGLHGTEAYRFRYYLQQFIIDEAAARAKKAEHLYDLLGMYYSLLRMWNEEQRESEAFQNFFGEIAEQEFINRAYNDISICSRSPKYEGFGWGTYIKQTAPSNEREHVRLFAEQIRAYLQNAEKENAGKGSVSGRDSKHGRGTTEGPAGRDGAAGAATKEHYEDQNSDDSSDWRFRILGIMAVVGIILAGLVGFMVGSWSASKKTEKAGTAVTTESEGTTVQEITEENPGDGKTEENVQEEGKPDPAEQKENKEATEESSGKDATQKGEGQGDEKKDESQSGDEKKDEAQSDDEKKDESQSGDQEGKEENSEGKGSEEENTDSQSGDDQGKSSEVEGDASKEAIEAPGGGYEYKIDESKKSNT